MKTLKKYNKIKSELEYVKGKTIKNFDLLTNADGDRVTGFDLIFKDNSVLEIYHIRCDKLDEQCKEKETTRIDCRTGEETRTKEGFVLGGNLFFDLEENE